MIFRGFWPRSRDIHRPQKLQVLGNENLQHRDFPFSRPLPLGHNSHQCGEPHYLECRTSLEFILSKSHDSLGACSSSRVYGEKLNPGYSMRLAQKTRSQTTSIPWSGICTIFPSRSHVVYSATEFTDIDPLKASNQRCHPCATIASQRHNFRARPSPSFSLSRTPFSNQVFRQENGVSLPSFTL